MPYYKKRRGKAITKEAREAYEKKGVIVENFPALADGSARVRLRNPIGACGAPDYYRYIDVPLAEKSAAERLQAVKEAVMNELQPEWNDYCANHHEKIETFVLKHDDIWLFRVKDQKLLEHGDKGFESIDDEDLGPVSVSASSSKKTTGKSKEVPEAPQERVIFEAREILDRAPAPCDRTSTPMEVKLYGLLPTHPDVKCSFQRLSPFFCGSFKKGERAKPFYAWSQAADDSIFTGNSLFARDVQETTRKILNEDGSKILNKDGKTAVDDPFTAGIKETQDFETYALTIPDYMAAYGDKIDAKSKEALGIYALANNREVTGRVTGSAAPKSAPKKDRKGFVSNVDTYFRSSFEQGTKIDHFLFVVDNSDAKAPNHISMAIHWGESNKIEEWRKRDWRYIPGPLKKEGRNLFFPADEYEEVDSIVKEVNGDLSHERAKTFLRKIYQTSEDEKPYYDDEGTVEIVFPAVSARLALSGLKVVASAEPLLLEEQEDPEVQKVWTASYLIYRCYHDPGVLSSIAALENAGYDVSKLDASSAEVLLKILEEESLDMEAAGADAFEDPYGCLDTLEEALRAHFHEPNERSDEGGTKR